MTEISTHHIKPSIGSRLLRLVSSTLSLQVITGGLIIGFLQVVLTISHASLIYGGALSPYLGQGIGYAMVGAFIIATIVSLFASLPGSVGSNQDVSVAIFSLISISIVSSVPPNTPLEETFYTVVAAIALTTFLTGLFFFGMGSLRLGGLVRYLPYPVVGGFLAGTGWLLFKGGFSLMNGMYTHSSLFQFERVCHWLPGLGLAVVMLISIKRIHNAFVLPFLLIISTIIFFATALMLNCSLAELTEQGWLLGPFRDQASWRPMTIEKLSMANWNVIAGQAANITAVLMVCSLSILLNASSLELVAKKDVDLNRELRSSGIGNLVSSFSPGFVGFMQISLTALNIKLNANSRVVGAIAAAIIGLTVVFGQPVIAYCPKIVLGAVLMYLGLTFLVEWGFETWSTLPKIDILIIWMILAIITVFGFLQGVAVGFMAAVIMFAISCSRTEVVRHELTGKSYQSRVTRQLEHRQLLDREGERIYLISLQGFIFFGTVDRLFNRIKSRLIDQRRTQPYFVILDFHRVDTLDSTGMLSFRKLKDLTTDLKIHIVITAPAEIIKRQLEQGGLPSLHPFIHYFSNLDSGFEWCEDEILKKEGMDLKRLPPPLEKQLEAIFPGVNSFSQLLDHLERQEIEPGVSIIRQGGVSNDLFFIESGRVTTQIDQSTGPPLRLETMKNSRIAGEVGFYLGEKRTASVVTDEDSVIYRLSIDKLKRLEKKNPETTSLLHQLVVRLLAERVTRLIRTVNALQK